MSHVPLETCKKGSDTRSGDLNLTMNNEDNVEVDDDAILQEIALDEPKEGPQKGEGLKPEIPIRGLIDESTFPEIVLHGAEAIFPDDFEYVLCIPKQNKYEKPKVVDGDNPNLARPENVVPQDWQAGVKFFINGVQKTFRNLVITIDDKMEIDAMNRVIPKFVKVDIYG